MAEITDQQQEIKKEKLKKALFDERGTRLVAEQKHQAAEECTKQGEAQLKDRKGVPSVAGLDKLNAEIEQVVSKCDAMTQTEDDEEFGETAVERTQEVEETTKRKSQHMIDGFFRQVSSQNVQLQWYEVENKYLRAEVENLRAQLEDGEFTVHFVNSLGGLK